MKSLSPHRPTTIALIIITVISVVAIVPAAGWAAASMMGLRTAPDLLVQVYVWCSLSLPVVLIVAPVLAWIAHALRRPGLALAVALAPMLWMLTLGLYVAAGRL